MSRRRPALQLDGGESGGQYHGSDELYTDDDPLGNMPTPERLVPTDIPVPEGSGDARPARTDNIDNKVANFLAEIDALDPGDEHSRSPAPYPSHDREEEPAAGFRQSPVRERSASPPLSRTSSAYSMFIKGKSEFMEKREEKSKLRDRGKDTVWPQEPETQWKQLQDEHSNYPYYWHTETNAVVWEMPPDFSQYLILHKEYEDRVERGLREGTLNPAHRPRPHDKRERDKSPSTNSSSTKHEKRKRSSRKKRHYSDDSDSSSGSDSDSGGSSHGSAKGRRATRGGKHSDVPPASRRDDINEADSKSKKAKLAPPETPATKSDTREPPAVPRAKPSPPAATNDDSMDFDDIDKELEMALERKRQELLRLEKEDTPEKDAVKSKPKDKDRDIKHDTNRKKSQDDDRKHDRHRRHDGRRDERRKDRHGDREKDRDRDRKSEKELRQSRLTLKDRLKIEMELKLEKERRKKKQIEEMMAKELEKTVGSSKGHKRSHRDRDGHEEPRKRYRDEESSSRSRPREEYDTRSADDYRHDYSAWGRDSRGMYDDVYDPPQYKPPPPTQEMIASESERKSKVVDYGHGRSAEHNGDSDTEDKRSADVRDLEMKKLEALQLAELALSKLEFLEVTKKGLSKLQILLIELETRHQDWQSGGLTTNHFLGKLREANWQLEQYEDSAAPPGWLCHWDRDYRRYFYTHKLTSKTQWEYPSAADIGDAKHDDTSPTIGGGKHTDTSKPKKSVSSEILTSASLPPPPPPPVEEHPLVKTLQLQYGSTSGSDSEDEQNTRLRNKKEEIPLPPPLPPSLPPKGEEREKEKEKHPEREKKEKHKKKKKKEKSKKKDKEKVDQNVPVGPMLPAGPPVDPSSSLDGQPLTYASAEIDGAPIRYSGDADIDGEPMDTDGAPGEAGLGLYDVSYDPAVNAPLASDGVAAHVYSQQPDANHNDQPLNFTGPAPENGATMGSDQALPESVPTELEYPDPYTGVSGEVAIGQGSTEVKEHTSEPSIWPTPGTDEKKKKKEKKDKMSGVNMALKKKHVSSLVQKWQKVKKEVEQEERHREERDSEIRRKLEEWKQDGLG